MKSQDRHWNSKNSYLEGKILRENGVPKDRCKDIDRFSFFFRFYASAPKASLLRKCLFQKRALHKEEIES